MKKNRIAVLAVAILAVSLLLAAVALADGGKKLDVKVGDSYFVCNCGDGCACKTISTNQGKCTCGNDLVKATVTRVEGEVAYFKAAGWEKERAFPTTGKYACACGAGCKCGTISQNPGKCPCGMALK
jgi:hypothetical protein